MKAIAIIEIPDGGKGKWYIDGMIRYTEDESLMKKFDADMIPLKPLPKKFDLSEDRRDGTGHIASRVWYRRHQGWNDCLDAITGETE